MESYPHRTVRAVLLPRPDFPGDAVYRPVVPRMVAVGTGDDPDPVIPAFFYPDAALSALPSDPYHSILYHRLILRDDIFRDRSGIFTGDKKILIWRTSFFMLPSG